MRTLHDLQFDNSYARLPEAFHQRVNPTPVPNARVVAFSPDAAKLIDLDPSIASDAEFIAAFTGQTPLPGSEPLAMKYAGHQFGSYVPQLGDGRAILLGEVRNERGAKWDLHLKGAGKTAFSRFGDGRAVLRSSIREYLASEAMHALGNPTTRALCVIGSDLEVYREGVEPGAVLVRMAPSHVRFGSFEVFAYREQFDRVEQLADYTIAQHFPHLAEHDDKYQAFLKEVVERTAKLVAQWQSVGFAHGVLNTDNMSILGLTLDYGPYGFMEDFDPGYICNHSDETGRYAFDQQPRIGYWNLACLAQALLSLMSVDDAKAALNVYPEVFNTHLHALMSAKIGIADPKDEDMPLWSSLLDVLAEGRADYTSFFRNLANGPDAVRPMFDSPAKFDEWAGRYRERLGSDEPAARAERMNRVNPKFILRNYLAQIAIQKAEMGDDSEVDRLREVLRRPFDEQPEMADYAKPSPEWGKRLSISCSS